MALSRLDCCRRGCGIARLRDGDGEGPAQAIEWGAIMKTIEDPVEPIENIIRFLEHVPD